MGGGGGWSGVGGQDIEIEKDGEGKKKTGKREIKDKQ